jgi:hypothetical protein
MDKILIKFTKPYSPYVIGDVTAQFEKNAKRYIEAGVAEEVKTKKVEKEVEAPTVDKKVKSPKVKK